MRFTLDEAIALADSAHRGDVGAGRSRGGERQRAVRRLVEAAGYGHAHQMTAVLHDDDEGSGIGPRLLAQARALGAPREVVAALESITRRTDPDEPGGWEPYLDGLVARAAEDDIGRVVKLFDGIVAMLPWHAGEPSERSRSLVDGRYLPAQARLLTAESLRRADGLPGPFPLERGSFLRYAIALDTRTRTVNPFAAVTSRLMEQGGDSIVGGGFRLAEGTATG